MLTPHDESRSRRLADMTLPAARAQERCNTAPGPRPAVSKNFTQLHRRHDGQPKHMQAKRPKSRNVSRHINCARKQAMHNKGPGVTGTGRWGRKPQHSKFGPQSRKLRAQATHSGTVVSPEPTPPAAPTAPWYNHHHQRHAQLHPRRRPDARRAIPTATHGTDRTKEPAWQAAPTGLNDKGGRDRTVAAPPATRPTARYSPTVTTRRLRPTRHSAQRAGSSRCRRPRRTARPSTATDLRLKPSPATDARGDRREATRATVALRQVPAI